MADTGVAWRVDGAVVWAQFSGDQFEERCLASAIAAHEPALVASGDRNRRAFEDGFALDPICQIVDMKHGLHAIEHIRPTRNRDGCP
ncbi:protein of unknown function [Candidatus Filomicrobium marinum]|uniref:Uncharacterized protein n=1 Tax=Candidatus Filomicrobium marinum TaxID=1608628 RepID=A0A0D6JKL7_9HYPH|nr:protein of unknown function [Candidatus Filomicrobium marinum]CPR22481.1 protein of unknown function [Candidatus Filomicrobium marinum]